MGIKSNRLSQSSLRGYNVIIILMLYRLQNVYIQLILLGSIGGRMSVDVGEHLKRIQT